MKNVLTVLIVVATLALVGGFVLAQSGNDLFQQALVKERAGKYEEAIKLYQIIEQKNSSDRKLAAKALFQIGQAYEKLGNAEARKTYERIAREFGDQKDVAADAGKRLAVLSAASISNNPGPRLLMSPDKNDDDAISLDGHSMAVTRSFGDENADSELAIQDVATGQLKRLLVGSCQIRPKPCTFPEVPVLSPDSRQVAFTWYDQTENDGQGQLRVVGTEIGAKPRVLVRNPEYSIWPMAWSPDAKSLLVAMRKGDRTWQLGWVSVSDGNLKVLKSLEWRIQGGGPVASLSPDGRYIAYSALATGPGKAAPTAADPKETHVYVLAADGSSEVDVVKMAAVNLFPVWTPDGQHIVFTSNLTGKSDLWSVAVRDVRMPGAPSLIVRDVGQIQPIGMTRFGSYYYRQRKEGVEQVSIAELTPPAGGRIGDRFVGLAAAWSPDGKSIAFLRHSTGRDSGFDLVTRSVEKADEKVHARNLPTSAGLPKWFNDGRGILLQVTPTPLSVVSVDTKSGELKQILPPFRDNTRTGVWALSPDDKTGYFFAGDLKTWNTNLEDRIMAFDLSTGQSKTVLMIPGTFEALPRPGGIGLALSPDGHTLAFTTIDFKTKEAHLALVGVEGGEYHQILSFHATSVNHKLAWTKDGRSVLFATSSDSANGDWRIMRIGIGGGEPEFTGLTVKALTNFDLSPDGSRIAFNSSVENTIFELMTIDNLAASLKDSK